MRRLLLRETGRHGVTIGLIFIMVATLSFMFLVKNWDELEYSILRSILVAVCVASGIGIVVCACMGLYNY